MGSYTRFNFKARLNKDTPNNVIKLLDDCINNNADCDWDTLLTGLNGNEDIKGGAFYKSGKYYTLRIDTEFKNYENQLKQFLDWIKPFIVGRKKKQYIGYHEWLDGEGDNRIYIYKKKQTTTK